ncbi:DUF1566 domain-containing protein [Bdellovibrio sp.]|uniref:Lcl domain-containing protein n=1 Tax=Bdellovibrio sp. TaxID=28201 RepID=UPI0039E4123F
MSRLFAYILAPLMFSLPGFAVAQHKGINFQAVIKKPDGTYPSASGLTVTLQILDPVTNCILREEEHSGKNVSNGYLNLVIGDLSSTTPTGKNPSPVLSITEVMDNSKQRTGLKCVDINNNIIASNQTYIPSNLDRRVLRVRLNIQGDEVVSDFNMRAVAFAVNSEMLNSKTESDFVNINNAKGVTKDNVESIFERFTKLDSILNSTKLDGLLTRTNTGGDSLSVNVTGNAATATTAANITGGINTLLPSQIGQSGKYLKTDGSNVSWETAGGGSGGGGLASVGLSLPSDVFQVTGSPLTADGSISSSFKSQTQKQVFAAPNATDGTPLFRQLQVSDIGNAKSAALYDVPVTGDAGTTQVVKGDDSRLVDARMPIDSSVTTSKIANAAVTDAKIDTVSGSKITGTVGSGALPVASETTVGIVNIIAQSFKGVKTFIDNVILQGSLTVSGTISSASLSSSGEGSFDRIKVANSSATCNGTTEGSLKYNSTSKKMEYCNGTSWTNISTGVLANLSIGAPSSSLVKSGPVAFDVIYGGTDVSTISLASGNITLGGTATVGCSVTSIAGTGGTRTVTVNGCTGTGTVNISVAANTAKSTTGEDAPAVGPSTSYNVDNTGPTAPTGVTLGSVPNNLTNSPTITYTAASDIGGSTVANHQVQIIKTSDSSVIRAWTNHTSGSDVGSLTLATNTQYSVLVRAVDALGNLGTSTTAVNWTSINDPCLGSPTPGTVCTGGAIFLGSLSPGATSGSGTDKYMTTPGGCGEIPAGQIGGGSGSTAWPNSDFTPTCSGADGLGKYWNDGTGNFYDIPSLPNWTSTMGTGYGASNTDQNYGATNTTNIVAITSSGQGGYHAAARYCDRLVYGGYSDWHLPNRYELNLMYTNKGSIPGLDVGVWYWSSTEADSIYSWVQRFSDGNQSVDGKGNNYLVRCVRRF